jgi:hypothetical protein
MVAGMTSLNRQDADLHYPDGSHRSTPPSTAGHMLEQHERRLVAHLAAHASEDRT